MFTARCSPIRLGQTSLARLLERLSPLASGLARETRQSSSSAARNSLMALADALIAGYAAAAVTGRRPTEPRAAISDLRADAIGFSSGLVGRCGCGNKLA